MANPKAPDSVKHSGIGLYADEHQMKRVNSVSVDSSFLGEDILELSNNGVAETIDDLETVSMTVDCHEFGSTDHLAQMCNFFAAADNNNHTITDASFDNAQVDFVLPVTSGTSTSALAGCFWFGSQWLTGFNLSYSADGYATESFTLEGEYKRLFLNALRDIKVVSGTYTSANVATVGENLTGYTGRIVTVNGIVKADMFEAPGGSSQITLTPGATTTVSAVDFNGTNVAFTSGDRIRVVCAKTVPSAFAALANTPAGIGALRRGMIDIYLYNTAGTEEKTLKLNSVSLDVALDREALPELGNLKMYSRSLNRPIKVGVTCEANLSDFEIFAKTAKTYAGAIAETTFDTMALNEIDWDTLSNTTKLVIKLYKSTTSHAVGNLLKTITITGLAMTGDGFNIEAGGIGTVSMNFNANNFQVVGSAVSPFLS